MSCNASKTAVSGGTDRTSCPFVRNNWRTVFMGGSPARVRNLTLAPCSLFSRGSTTREYGWRAARAVSRIGARWLPGAAPAGEVPESDTRVLGSVGIQEAMRASDLERHRSQAGRR